MKLLLHKDSHLFNYQTRFGSTTTFSPTLFVGNPWAISDIEPIGSVMCTAFTADKVKSGETGKAYDHNWLWSQMNMAGEVSNTGASPKDAFATAVKGQKVSVTGEIETSAAYVQTEIGQYDFFTNVKSFIQMEYNKGFKRPVGVGTWWFYEWENVVVLPMGKTHITDHEWEIVGWDANYPDCFQIDTHEGAYKYIPRNVFNEAMDITYGSVALSLMETTQEDIDYLKDIKVSLLQEIYDLAYNIYVNLQATFLK